MYNGIHITDDMINSKKYDGNTFKFGITVNNEDYIVKMRNNTISSIYSEYIASRFISSIGINCHKVYFGYYRNELCIIMKDFTTKESKLRSFKDTQQSSEDTDIKTKKYTYSDVIDLIEKHSKLNEKFKKQAINQFWQMFICDAILGNRDRHHGNWGYLMEKTGYRMAPIYDNGSSLFPDVERQIGNYVNHIKEGTELKFISERAEKFPASLFQIETSDGKTRRTNYNEILSDLRINKTLAFQVRSIKENVGFEAVYRNTYQILQEAREFIPGIYVRFYLIIICVRYLHLIERKSIEKSYEITINRIKKGMEHHYS